MSALATYNPTARIQITFAQDTPAGVFVKADGTISGAGTLAIGVTENAYNSGDVGSIIISETALIKSAGVMAQGDLVMSDASGYGVTAVAGNYANGILLKSAVANEYVEILLKTVKI